MELNIAIVDDLKTDRERIKMLISQTESDKDNFNVTEFDSADNFFKAYRKGAFQVIFLDICLCREHERLDFPKDKIISGIALSRQLRLNDEDIAIIFMSTTKEFVFDTFTVHPFDYIIKPETDVHFSELMGKIRKHFTADVKEIKIKSGGTTLSVPVRDIMQVYSGQHGVCIKMITGKEFDCFMNYSHIKEILGKEPGFLECNRGMMINMDYAVNIKSGCFVMQDGVMCSIRVREKKKITDTFASYTANKLQKGVYI